MVLDGCKNDIMNEQGSYGAVFSRNLLLGRGGGVPINVCRAVHSVLLSGVAQGKSSSVCVGWARLTEEEMHDRGLAKG